MIEFCLSYNRYIHFFIVVVMMEVVVMVMRMRIVLFVSSKALEFFLS